MHYEDNQGMNYQQYKESQYDLLADTLRKYLDMGSGLWNAAGGRI